VHSDKIDKLLFWECILSDDILVDIEDLHFSYDGRPVLQGINMKIPRGKVVAIMGGSGCGKTTLLRCIGGQLRPTGGRVRLEKHQVCGMSQAELYRLRRRMGMLFQFGALFTDMSVFDNVAFPMREHTDLSEEMIRDRVEPGERFVVHDQHGIEGQRSRQRHPTRHAAGQFTWHQSVRTTQTNSFQHIDNTSTGRLHRLAGEFAAGKTDAAIVRAASDAGMA
jgi:ABC-type methionine transport system ATPase subunit